MTFSKPRLTFSSITLSPHLFSERLRHSNSAKRTQMDQKCSNMFKHCKIKSRQKQMKPAQKSIEKQCVSSRAWPIASCSSRSFWRRLRSASSFSNHGAQSNEQTKNKSKIEYCKRMFFIFLIRIVRSMWKNRQNSFNRVHLSTILQIPVAHNEIPAVTRLSARRRERFWSSSWLCGLRVKTLQEQGRLHVSAR